MTPRPVGEANGRGSDPKPPRATRRIAQYVPDMATGIRQNVAAAKMHFADRDGTMITVTLEAGEIVVRINGAVSSRTPVGEGQDPDAALDAADRAMQAHRDIHGAR